MPCTLGRPSRARAWPARPRVPSSTTAPGRSRAGPSRASTRSARTGWCPEPAAPMEPPSALDPAATAGAVAQTSWSGARPGPHPREGADGPGPPGAGEVTSAGLATQRGWRPRRAPGAGAAPSENSGQHLLGRAGEGVFLLGQVGRPGGGVPDLQPGVGADHHAVPLQLGVVAQAGRDRDAALLVRDLVGGAGKEHAAVVADRLGRYRGGAERLGNAGEF